MKVKTSMWKCKCGKHIIILGEKMEDIPLKTEDILCPICGEEMESSTTRTLTIGDIQ